MTAKGDTSSIDYIINIINESETCIEQVCNPKSVNQWCTRMKPQSGSHPDQSTETDTDRRRESYKQFEKDKSVMESEMTH